MNLRRPLATGALAAALLAGCGASDSSTDTGGQAGACPLTAAATPCAGPATPAASASTSTSAGQSSSAACNPAATQRTDNLKQTVSLTARPDGLKTGEITPGSGAAAAAGNTVAVEYTGWLQDGSVFDSSRKAGRTPFSFQLGAGSVIPGWDEGVPGMKVGGVRRLVIPPALAYGPQGQGPIPANATLTFDIELLAVC